MHIYIYIMNVNRVYSTLVEQVKQKNMYTFCSSSSYILLAAAAATIKYYITRPDNNPPIIIIQRDEEDVWNIQLD